MTNIIRRPDFAGGDPTAEEKIKMDAVAAFWIKNAMRTDRADPEEVRESIVALYAAAGLPAPIVVTVPSPAVMAFAGGFASAIWFRRSATLSATISATYRAMERATDSATERATYSATRSATLSATLSATERATLSATYSATERATYSATASATERATDSATASATYGATLSATISATYRAMERATDSATERATYSATRSATLSATLSATERATDSATERATLSATEMWRLATEMSGDTSEADFWLECARRWASTYQGGNMWSGWCAYASSARDVLGLRLSEHAAYAAWERAAQCGGFRWMHEKFCLVSDFPEVLRVDDQNRPHCEDGPSHRWRDGWSLYHWHGAVIPAEWVEDKTSLTPKIALTWENIEQRRAACEILGWAKILRELNAIEIDRDEDPMVGSLLEVTLPDLGREKFLRVLCGTGREFAIPVPPEMTTALQANAWTYNLPTDFIRNLEVRT